MKGLQVEAEFPIKYRAPYLDHFTYGLRFNRWSMRREGEFIDMVEDKEDND
jgi:hypothetical protein